MATQTINSDTVILVDTQQLIGSDSTVLIVTEQTITSNTEMKEPLEFFAEAQVTKLFEDDKEIETDVTNDIPAAPTTLICVDAGLGDSLRLTWTSTAKFFNVYRKDPGPVFVKVNDNVLEDITTYITGGLPSDIPATFIVRAANGLAEESPNSNEVTCTPTFSPDRCTEPTYEIKINSVVFDQAILSTINLGFGSNISRVAFTLPIDPRLAGNPTLDDEVEITLNGKFVFKGFITTRSNVINEEGGLRISYNCNSTIINLTKKALRDITIDGSSVRFNTFLINPDGEAVILNRKNADQILDSFGVTGGPSVFPGQVDVTDLTPLAASELVLSSVGNFKLYHNMSTGGTSVYNFGSGGLVTREFGFGKNIINFDIQESNIDTVNAIEVIGAPIAVKRKKRIFVSASTTASGAQVAQAELSGKNIRDISVFGFTREQPRITLDHTVTVSLLDFGVTSGTPSLFTSGRSKKLTSNLSFGSGSSITNRKVIFDPVKRTAQIDVGSGSLRVNVSQGSTFKDPTSGKDFKVNFTRNGEFQLVRSVSGQTAQIIVASPLKTTTSRFTSKFKSEASREATSTLPDEDVRLRPTITDEKIYETVRQPIAANIEYFGKDKIHINLSAVPKAWFAVTKAGRVDKTLLGAGSGTFTARILMWMDWRPGAIEVEFTIDENPPVVKVGSGAVCRTITDRQYAILKDNVTGFNNSNRILQEMTIRANAELARANQIVKSGSITVIGDENLDLRQSVNVDGEKLEVSGIVHSFVDGFTTTVSLTNERFFQTLILPQPIALINQRNKKAEERSRKSINLNFENRQFVEARKHLQRDREGFDKEVPASGPFSIYGGGTR